MLFHTALFDLAVHESIILKRWCTLYGSLTSRPVGLGDAVVEAVLPGWEVMNAGGHAMEAHA